MHYDRGSYFKTVVLIVTDQQLRNLGKIRYLVTVTIKPEGFGPNFHSYLQVKVAKNENEAFTYLGIFLHPEKCSSWYLLIGSNMHFQEEALATSTGQYSANFDFRFYLPN